MTLADILPGTLLEAQVVRRQNQKGETRKQLKARKDRTDAKALKAFRDAVWNREAAKDPWSGSGDGWVSIQWAYCEHCGETVLRCSEISTGDVHHRIGRRNKSTRYDPRNGVLLCNSMGKNCHGKAQRHEITV